MMMITRLAHPHFPAVMLWVALTLYSRPGRATTFEERLILDMEAAAAQSSPPWVPRLLFRLENRYDEENRVHYEQFTLGMTQVWRKNFKTAFYTTPREVFARTQPDTWKNVHGADAIVFLNWNRWTVADRETVEWHATDGFWRNRNQVDLRFRAHPQLQVFGSYEGRWDLDAKRVNMQTAVAGLAWQARPAWSVRLMIAQEWNRRNLPRWDAVRFLGIVLALAL